MLGQKLPRDLQGSFLDLTGTWPQLICIPGWWPNPGLSGGVEHAARFLPRAECLCLGTCGRGVVPPSDFQARIGGEVPWLAVCNSAMAAMVVGYGSKLLTPQVWTVYYRYNNRTAIVWGLRVALDVSSLLTCKSLCLIAQSVPQWVLRTQTQETGWTFSIEAPE
jgi:hypothetical protein